MRKIEQQMLAAVRSNCTFGGGNTTVCVNGQHLQVLLHGHEIASGPVGALTVNLDTLRDWPTNTTMSRLRALGFNVYRKGGVPMLDGNPV